MYIFIFIYVCMYARFAHWFMSVWEWRPEVNLIFIPQEPSVHLWDRLSLTWCSTIKLGQHQDTSTCPYDQHFHTSSHNWTQFFMLHRGSPWHFCMTFSPLSKNEMFFPVTAHNCIFYSLLDSLNQISPFCLPSLSPHSLFHAYHHAQYMPWAMTLIISQNSTIFPSS